MSTAAVSLNSVALSTQTVSEKKNTARVHPLTSLFAGAVAGGVEAGMLQATLKIATSKRNPGANNS